MDTGPAMAENTTNRPKAKRPRPKSQHAAYARMMERVNDLVGDREHILAGPWLGEIGYELLYWIPYLRWLREGVAGFSERLTVCSRGGVDSWYADLTPRYIEVF